MSRPVQSLEMLRNHAYPNSINEHFCGVQFVRQFLYFIHSVTNIVAMQIPPRNVSLHSSLHHEVLRRWLTVGGAFAPDNFMYPIFVTDEETDQDVESMPGISRLALANLLKHVTPLMAIGLSSVIIFGVPSKVTKDETGSSADNEYSVVIKAIKILKEACPNLLVACDVCLCAYVIHGHCGILNEDSTINLTPSIRRMSEIALSYARAGCDVIAPSDMMDGRIGAINELLTKNGLRNKVAIMSYSAKFASCFYGPFRDAANSAPSFGNRKCYQLPPASDGLALRAVARDVMEGADMLMVKPSLLYLDIVRKIKDRYQEYPVVVYHVSGEYSMACCAAQAGILDLREVVMETFSSMRRAGADLIITYFTPRVLKWLMDD